MKVILVLAFLAVVLQATAASSTRAIRQYDVQIMGETPIRHLHRVEPGKKTTFNVHVPRDFSSTELLANLQLVSQHDGSLKLALKSIHDDSLEFEGEWIAPQREGVFDHHWLLNGGSKKRSATGVTSTLEVTCSNGVFCDGIERLVNGQCQKERSPCDDADDCTTDTCIEAFGGKCFNKAKTGCDICFSDCVADCSGRTCGEDGCGGFCGRCPSGQGCLDGVCLAATADGTCESPLPLLTTQGLANFFDTTHFVEGDTSQGIDVKVPVCNSLSGAQELIYTFTVPQVSESYVGIEAMMSGFDSVLQIFEDNCNGTVLQCSDDSSPPGNLGSRVVATLKPGKTYLLMADGYNLEQRGPFNLEIRFHKGCLPNCDGQFCGDDGCGGACGVCDGEEQCFEGSCIPDPCTPNCVSEDRECGDDGCGGTCGECTAANTYCLTDQREDGTVYFLGQCSDPFPSCNNLSPVCDGCTTSQFCGSDCTCYDLNAPLPDLVIDGEILSKEIYLEIASFSNSSCALSEGCVLGPGNRALLRFSVVSINQGLTDFFPPAPKTRPDLFVYGQCHRHYHFTKFSEYILKDTKGRQVTTGRKEAYCMEDSYQYIEGPQIQCLPAYDCGAQGIQRGWADIYGATLDCQWIDVTDIDSGEYDLTVKVNPSRIFTEKSFENNEVSFRIVIPDFDLSSLGILPIDVLAETSDSSNNNSPSSNNNSPNSPNSPSSNNNSPNSPNSSNGSSGSSNGSSGSSDAGFLLPALVVFLGVFFLLF